MNMLSKYILSITVITFTLCSKACSSTREEGFIYKLSESMSQGKKQEAGTKSAVHRDADPLVIEWVNKELQSSGIGTVDVFVEKEEGYLSAYGSRSIFTSPAVERFIKRDALRDRSRYLWYPWARESSYLRITAESLEDLTEYKPTIEDKRVFNAWIKNPYKYEELRDLIRGNLWHEAGHLKNRDYVTDGLKQWAFYAHFIPTALFSFGLSKMITDSWKTSFKTMGAVTSGIGLTNYFFLKNIKTRSEARADEHIPNDHDLLKAQHNAYQYRNEMFQELPLRYRMMIRCLDVHPSDASRAARFAERLKALEKKK